jgi:hypothetical protein
LNFRSWHTDTGNGSDNRTDPGNDMMTLLTLLSLLTPV